MPWITRGLRNGVVTSGWPRRTDPYFDQFHAAVDVLPGAGRRGVSSVDRIEDLCPTRAIAVSRDAVDAAAADSANDAVEDDDPAQDAQWSVGVSLDRGRCILCGRCVRRRPDLFGWAPGADVARAERDQLVVGDVPETEDNLAAVRAELASRVRTLRRSVHIRHVDTGSDGSAEWEIQALTNPVYDLHRLGIFFTASPRHADIMLVTGIGAAGMWTPLRKTLDAMPDPVVVIAAGAEAISGGVLHSSYTGRGGVGEVANVDIWVPGSPASPFSLLHAILLALGRVPTDREGGVRRGRAGAEAPDGSSGATGERAADRRVTRTGR